MDSHLSVQMLAHTFTTVNKFKSTNCAFELRFHQLFIDQVVLMAEPHCKFISRIQIWRKLFDFVTEISCANFARVKPRKSLNCSQHIDLLTLSRCLRVREAHSMQNWPCSPSKLNGIQWAIVVWQSVDNPSCFGLAKNLSNLLIIFVI